MSEQVVIAGLIGTLGGVVLKWLLDQVSESRRLHREERVAIGRMMADLLMIWVQQDALVKSLAELRGVLAPLEMPLKTQLDVEAWATELLPKLDDVHARYKESIGVVAGSDPVLAARMQGTMQFLGRMRHFLMAYRAQADENPSAMTLFLDMNQKIEANELTAIRSHILALARLHGWITLFRVWRYLHKPLQMSLEDEDFDSRLRAVLDPYKGELTNPPQVQET